jgi:hypothetical protein
MKWIKADDPSEEEGLEKVKKKLEHHQMEFGPGKQTLERWLGKPGMEFYKIPADADYVGWDDANEILSFMPEQELIATAQENMRTFAGEDNYPQELKGIAPEDIKTGQQAIDALNKIWEGDPGGRGFIEPIEEGTYFIVLDRTKKRPNGSPIMYQFDSPPSEGISWTSPGYV